MAQYFCYDPEQERQLFEPGSGSKGIDPVLLLFLQIRHIMYYMIKTYIIKIQSRNLIHDHRLLAAPKISFQMIAKNKDPYQDHPVINDPGSGSNFLNLNRDRDGFQKYWANMQLNVRVTFFMKLPVDQTQSTQFEAPQCNC